MQWIWKLKGTYKFMTVLENGCRGPNRVENHSSRELLGNIHALIRPYLTAVGSDSPTQVCRAFKVLLLAAIYVEAESYRFFIRVGLLTRI